MAEIGSVTIQVTPVIPEDLQEQVEAQVREAVADVLRRVADSLTAKPAAAAVDQSRYYVEKINGIWGVRDREVPNDWVAWGDDGDGRRDAEQSADDLNAGAGRDYLAWSEPGTYS